MTYLSEKRICGCFKIIGSGTVHMSHVEAAFVGPYRERYHVLCMYGFQSHIKSSERNGVLAQRAALIWNRAFKRLHPVGIRATSRGTILIFRL